MIFFFEMNYCAEKFDDNEFYSKNSFKISKYFFTLKIEHIMLAVKL